MDVKRWSPIFPKHPLAASPGSCPISVCTRPPGGSDTGESFVVGVYRSRSPSEPAWSRGFSSQSRLPDSSSIQPGPTRLCCSARCLNWTSATNLLAVLTVESKKGHGAEAGRAWGRSGLGGWEVEEGLRELDKENEVKQNEERCYSQ